MSALIALFISAGLGAIVMTIGIYVLAGVGWALIGLSACLFAVAWLLHLGIAHG